MYIKVLFVSVEQECSNMTLLQALISEFICKYVRKQHFPYHKYVAHSHNLSFHLLSIIPAESNTPVSWLTAMTGTGLVVLLVVILPLIVVLLILICRSYTQHFKKASENRIYYHIQLMHMCKLHVY